MYFLTFSCYPQCELAWHLLSALLSWTQILFWIVSRTKLLCCETVCMYSRWLAYCKSYINFKFEVKSTNFWGIFHWVWFCSFYVPVTTEIKVMALWKVKYSPAVVMAAQTSFSIWVFEGVVRVLEGLIPEKARFTPMQAGLVLEAPVVFSVGSVTLCKKRERERELRL